MTSTSQSSALVEEETFFRTVRDSLFEAQHYFQKGSLPPPSTAGTPHASSSAPAASPLTPQQAQSIVETLTGFLRESSEDSATYVLSRLCQTDALVILLKLFAEPLFFTPSAATGFAAQQSFVGLRVASLSALAAIVDRATTVASDSMRALCDKAFRHTRLVDALLMCPGNSTVPEPVRIAAAENLFFLLLRMPWLVERYLVAATTVSDPSGDASAAVGGLLDVVTKSMILDGSTKVRELCACMLRELAGTSNTVHTVATTVNATAAAIRLLTTDASTEVRVLCAEVLQQCFLHAPREMAYYIQQPQPLVTAVVGVLQHQTKVLLASSNSNDSPTVATSEVRNAAAAQLSAALALLQEAILVADSMMITVNGATTTSSPSQQWFEALTGAEVPRRLCQLVTSFHVDVMVAARAAATLRALLERSPPGLQVAASLVHHFPTLSSLLKAVLDLGKATDDGLGNAPQDTTPTAAAASRSDTAVLCSELGLAVALLLAHHDSHRRHLQTELLAVPTWSSLLKVTLSRFLNQTPMEVFAVLRLCDGTGVVLNEVPPSGKDMREGDGVRVEWSDVHKPRRESVLAIFAKQQDRSRGASLVALAQTHHHSSSSITSPLYVPSATDTARRAKLTFVLLTVAVHMAFSPPVETAGTTPNDNEAREAVVVGSAGQQQHHSVATPAGPTNRHTMDVSGDEFGLAAVQQQQQQQPMPSSSSPSPAPLFPRLSKSGSHSQSGGGGGAHRAVMLTPAQREAMAVSFDKFNAAFALTVQFSQFFQGRSSNSRAEGEASPTVTYRRTDDALVVRTQRLKNPWATVLPVEDSSSVHTQRAWTVQDVQFGDLFYFAVPFDQVSESSVELVLQRAQRHLTTIRKAIVTTPQIQKSRRWLLHDLLHHVLPQTIAVLEHLRQLCRSHGEDGVRFPVFLFREREMHLGVRALHPGNLVDVVQQVDFYFSQHPEELVGIDSSQTMQALQQRVQQLMAEGPSSPLMMSEAGGGAGARMMTATTGQGTAAAAEDDDWLTTAVGEYGHGGISSESDNES